MKLLSRFLPFLVFFLAVSPAYAMTTRGGNSVFISKDEVITGTLLAGGNSVTIDGVVHGDVFCGSQALVISGTVDGDVICGAQSIRIAGTVGGSVRAAAQAIDIAGIVKRNLTAVGQTIAIDSTGSVTGEILAAAQSVRVDGNVGGDISTAVETLTFGNNAKVGGSVRYESKTAATLAPTATIAGTLIQTTPKPEAKNMIRPERLKPTFIGGSANIIWKIIMYAVLAIIINAVAPKRTERILDLMKKKPVPMAITGIIVLIVVPVIMLGLVITLVGIPFAILLGIVYALVLAASRIFAAILAGEYLTAQLHLNPNNKIVPNIILGVLVTWLVFSIPVLGGLLSGWAMIWGLGAIYQSRKALPTKRK